MVKDVFSKYELEGLYIKQSHPHKKHVFYMKEKPFILYLLKSENHQWMVSSKFGDSLQSDSSYMYQDMAENTIPDQKAPWKVKVARVFKTVPDISFTPSDANGNQQLVIILSVSFVVCISILFAVFITVYLKKKKKCVEEPVLDDNMYYGDEGDDYTYGETRVTDTNDYYYDDD